MARTTVGRVPSGSTVTVTERSARLKAFVTTRVYTEPLSAMVNGGVMLVKELSSTRTPFFSQR